MGRQTHKLVSGQEIGLEGLDKRELEFLRSLKAMARQAVSYFEIARIAVGPGSPALRGRGRVTREIVQSPLYLAARDIATRAGIAQGLILAPEHEKIRRDIPADRSLMSVVQAADLIDITRAAVYKAIRAGLISARRYGNVTLVERESAIAYRDRRKVRQAAASTRE